MAKTDQILQESIAFTREMEVQQHRHQQQLQELAAQHQEQLAQRLALETQQRQQQ